MAAPVHHRSWAIQSTWMAAQLFTPKPEASPPPLPPIAKLMIGKNGWFMKASIGPDPMKLPFRKKRTCEPLATFSSKRTLKVTQFWGLNVGPAFHTLEYELHAGFAMRFAV